MAAQDNPAKAGNGRRRVENLYGSISAQIQNLAVIINLNNNIARKKISANWQKSHVHKILVFQDGRKQLD